MTTTTANTISGTPHCHWRVSLYILLSLISCLHWNCWVDRLYLWCCVKRKLKIVVALKVFDKMLKWKCLEFSFNCLCITTVFVFVSDLGCQIFIEIEISSTSLIAKFTNGDIFLRISKKNVNSWFLLLMETEFLTLSLKIWLLFKRICEWNFDAFHFWIWEPRSVKSKPRKLRYQP